MLIKWNDFVRTNYGIPVEPQTEIMRQKVRSVGVGLTDRIQGPFELCIERIWATNNASEADTVLDLSSAAKKGAEVKIKDEGDVPAREGPLKTKQGQTISWKS